MTENFNIVNDSDRHIIIQKLSIILNEKEEVIETLIPIWNSIVLASVLRLTINRNRYSALQNFMAKRTIPLVDISNFTNSSNDVFSREKILDYGESFMGVLIPDKKSALATVLSQDLNFRSSLILKGLAVYFALYGNFFSDVTNSLLLQDWKSFVEFFGSYKNNIFDLNFPAKAQKSISEILLISEIYKESNSHLLTHSEDVDLASGNQLDNEISFYNSKKFILAFLILLITLIIGAYWYLNKNAEPEVVNDDIEEIIPVDTLNKLHDSLSKAVVDSSQLKSDTITTLIWPKGKEFQVPTNSSLVKLHHYLNDSTQVESIQIPTFEFSFDVTTDQVVSKDVQYFKYLVEGLNKYKKVKIRIYAFAENDTEKALKRGYMLKNRLVGEGLSPKRIEVKSNRKLVNPDLTKPLNEQVVFEFQKSNY